MVLQLLTSIFATLLTTRMLLFVVGLAVGGVLAVSWGTYTEWMLGLTSIWNMVVAAVIGK